MVSSSSSSVNWRYDVFVSCYGPDVHSTFLSHLRKELSNNGMKMFDDQWIERGLPTISPQIRRAIRESRISIVVLSKNYASSTLCLDELLEIFKCKKDNEQIVMTVFYGVDPSDVWKQTNEFGKGFKETCAYIKTEELKQKWRQALEDVRNIDGESFRKWDNEWEMTKKIAINVLNQLPVSKGRDIEQGLVVYETSSPNKHETSSPNKRKIKSRCFTVMAFFVVINLLLEIASTVADQLSTTRKSYFTRISLAMSVLSVVLSILDLTYKIRAHKACFRCKWPIPWFYYPSHDYRRIFGSFNDTVLLFCVVGGLVVSTINYSFIEKGKDGPIKVSLWPLFFAIGMVGAKFREKPVIWKDHSL